MKVFSVIGISKTGKTTVVEQLASKLTARGCTVGSVKEIHFEGFELDTPGSNTDRHRQAGSQLVTALGLAETDIMYPRALKVKEILKHYDQDYVILEGTRDYNCPKIITAANEAEIDELLAEQETAQVIAISGRIAEKLTEYKGLPVINVLTHADVLTDMVQRRVFEALPNFSEKCCGMCGKSCAKMCEDILEGRAKREDCRHQESEVRLYFDGEPVRMVSFVESILKNTMMGLAKELDGYRPGCHIKLEIGYEDRPDA